MNKTALKIVILAILIATIAGLNPAGFPRARAEETSKGRIIVRSNVMTSWIISGPDNFSGTGNFGSYYAQPGTQDYFISAPGLKDLVGPTILPGMNQTLKAGETIYFDIMYNYQMTDGSPENCDKHAYALLDGKFINDGKSTGVATATMTNRSKACTYTVGIASYKMYYEELSTSDDTWLESQTLFQTKNFTLAPGQTLGPEIVQIALPPCRAQVDLFEGIALTPPVYNTQGHFLMDFRFVDKTVCPLFETGVLNVNSNIPTSWIINGPQNFSGSGTYGAYTTQVGSYTLNNVPTTLVYNNKNYELTSTMPQTQAVTANIVTQFTIQYAEKWTINEPRISGTSNAQCSKINISWNDNSDNESGFRLYRSTQNSNNLENYQLVVTLPANSTGYTDSPALNNSYYYIVAAFSNSPATTSASNAFYSAFNVPCSAQLEGSMQLVAVNGSSNFTTTGVKNGDTLTFELLVDNLGPSDGFVTKITESVSANLTNPRNLNATGQNLNIGSPRISGNSPEFTMNITGRKNVGGNKWVIRYDVTASFLDTDPTAAFSNCATIHYRDQTGDKTERVCANQLLKSTENSPGLRFREVAP